MKPWLIIDGYNLIFRLPPGRPNLPPDMAGKRRFLLEMLEETAGVLAERITVVFDGGRTGPADAAPEGSRTETLFSPPGKTADTVIEQLVCGAERPAEICVVTSDRSENDGIRASGAEAMSCAMFLDQWDQARRQLSELIARRAVRAPKFRLGDLFPE